MTAPFSVQLAEWALSLTHDEVPADLIQDACHRVLDVIGTVVAGAWEPLGEAMIASAAELGAGDETCLIPTGRPVPASSAVLVHGTLGHAIDFDDTHTATLVHPSVPVVATALAVGHKTGADTREILACVVIGNEVLCRLGMVAPMAFHRSGLHPTSVLAPPGAALLAARLRGLDTAQAVHAIGISGSQASGILESFADGTWVKTMHPGWAAHGGVVAASLAAAGFTGPATMLEGRFGLFKSHVQREDETLDFDAMTRSLGIEWEARRCSLKAYACAHVIHPYIDLAINLARDGIDPASIDRIEAPIQQKYLPVVGEPREAKIAPRTPTHARASLQFCIASALLRGNLDPSAFLQPALSDQTTRDLAARVEATADRHEVSQGQFRGELTVTLKNGRQIHRTQDNVRGSIAHPLSEGEILDKFRANVDGTYTPEQADEVIQACLSMDDGYPVEKLIHTCLARQG